MIYRTCFGCGKEVYYEMLTKELRLIHMISLNTCNKCERSLISFIALQRDVYLKKWLKG